jgi:serine protease Do
MTFRLRPPICGCLWAMALAVICEARESAETPKSTGRADLAMLTQVQQEVQQRLREVKGALVAIQTGGGTASGVIISAEGLLLTAAHVVDKPGRDIRVVLDGGRVVTARSLGLDKSADAALAQLKGGDGKPWPYVKLCRDLSACEPGAWCFALGHPGGFDRARGGVLRVGRVIKQTANSLHTDCVLMGGDSGGPLFNLAGEVIGIHSQIWEGRDQNVHVSMAPFLRSWEAMRSSEVVRTWAANAGGYLGLVTRMNDEIELEIIEIIDGSPAQKAGLRPGEIVMSLNDEAMTEQGQFSAAVRAKASGEVVRLRLRSPQGKERTTELKLAPRPTQDG